MRRRYTQLAAYGLTSGPQGFLGVASLGDPWFVATNGNDGRGTRAQDPTQPLLTVGQAISNAAAGDIIYIAPGTYAEAVTISKSLTLFGLGGRGGPAIAPSASNGVAITIDASAAKLTDITLTNIGGEGNGTGGGLLVHASAFDVRRLRAHGCKFEGGAYAVTMKGTGTGNSVGDTMFFDIEFGWSTDGVIMTNGVGGDVVTETLFRNCFWHDITTDCIKDGGFAHEQTWLVDSWFANAEGGTAPTRYLKLDAIGHTGLVTGCRFATTVLASSKLAIASNVLFVGNYAEAEGPATGGGTSGRPD